jgi:hypothetical protein
MKEAIYELGWRNNGHIATFTLIPRVVCTLIGHNGRFVRRNHSWHQIHEIEAFNALKQSLKDSETKILFYGYIQGVPRGESLPYIDPTGVNSPGLYEH